MAEMYTAHGYFSVHKVYTAAYRHPFDIDIYNYPGVITAAQALTLAHTHAHMQMHRDARAHAHYRHHFAINTNP